ncbi:MAG: mucoidy inhibitor MuiA family protein [Deltaproteobacteria bacterium]|nr:mucoidy inhibitor MuiA family protein [Deltaproteobacteria bacterium]
MNGFFRQLSVSFILVAFLVPSFAAASPREVTLYPNSAKVVDTLRVALQPAGNEAFKAVVTLPGQAVPDTLTALLPRNSPLRIDDQSWKQVNRQDDAKLADLRRQIQNLKAERIGILSGIQALDAQIKFWQEQAKVKPKSIEETGVMAALIARSVKKTFQDKLTLEPDLEKTDKKIRELQEEMNRIGGQKEDLWEVTFLLSGPAAKEASLTLTYVLNGCGWTPLYRLEALPRDGVIHFTWEAEIWQSSGSDWNQVAVNLATLPARSVLSPPDLPQWIIRPRQQAILKSRAMEELREMSAAAPMPFDLQEVPREIRESTYSLWNIGMRNIPAGARQRLKIRFENWTADFVHLIRPGLTAQAFIQASVKLAEAKDIPAGQATFMIDGAILAKRSFSFAGQEGRFTFGADPLVTTETVLLSRKAGEKGFIADKQTQEWSWRYDIKNARDTAVRIRLEDSLPQVRDERIKLFLKGEPEPTEKTAEAMIWLQECAAGGRLSVVNTVRLEAPKEMDLDLGGRR